MPTAVLLQAIDLREALDYIHDKYFFMEKTRQTRNAIWGYISDHDFFCNDTYCTFDFYETYMELDGDISYSFYHFMRLLIEEFDLHHNRNMIWRVCW